METWQSLLQGDLGAIQPEGMQEDVDVCEPHLPDVFVGNPTFTSSGDIFQYAFPECGHEQLLLFQTGIECERSEELPNWLVNRVEVRDVGVRNTGGDGLTDGREKEDKVR